MILGDNIFYGNGFSKILKTAAANAETKGRCTVFGYYVQDPERFGIVEFDQNGKVLSVEEKPEHPKSNYASPACTSTTRKWFRWQSRSSPLPAVSWRSRL